MTDIAAYQEGVAKGAQTDAVSALKIISMEMQHAAARDEEKKAKADCKHLETLTTEVWELCNTKGVDAALKYIDRYGGESEHVRDLRKELDAMKAPVPNVALATAGAEPEQNAQIPDSESSGSEHKAQKESSASAGAQDENLAPAGAPGKLIVPSTVGTTKTKTPNAAAKGKGKAKANSKSRRINQR